MKQKIRLAFILMCGVYPLINFLLYITSIFTWDWPIWAKTIPVVPFVVLGIVLVEMPLINKYFGKWIKGD